jgi:hypothetical protein
MAIWMFRLTEKSDIVYSDPAIPAENYNVGQIRRWYKERDIIFETAGHLGVFLHGRHPLHKGPYLTSRPRGKYFKYFRDKHEYFGLSHKTNCVRT